ncbi:MAG: GNAT family N-acetyltransferase [Chloroflexi bacterium]|nr:GNAT family N-acetyltransferase [Chloroflexota bacterium]
MTDISDTQYSATPDREPDGEKTQGSGNFFPPGLAVRAIRPTDNEAVRDLFIAGQNEIAATSDDIKVRIAVKDYTSLCLHDDMKRPSVHYSQFRRKFWVLESQERKIVGMCALDEHETEVKIGQLRRLGVAPEFRRKGVAKLLVQRTEQYAAKQGMTGIRLFTSELQPGARALYESLGYTVRGTGKYGPITVYEYEKSLGS